MTDVVAATIGRLETAVKGLKTGVRVALKDAATRARKVQLAAGGTVADIQEAMETEYYDFCTAWQQEED